MGSNLSTKKLRRSFRRARSQQPELTVAECKANIDSRLETLRAENAEHDQEIPILEEQMTNTRDSQSKKRLQQKKWRSLIKKERREKLLGRLRSVSITMAKRTSGVPSLQGDTPCDDAVNATLKKLAKDGKKAEVAIKNLPNELEQETEIQKAIDERFVKPDASETNELEHEFGKLVKENPLDDKISHLDEAPNSPTEVPAVESVTNKVADQTLQDHVEEQKELYWSLELPEIDENEIEADFQALGVEIVPVDETLHLLDDASEAPDATTEVPEVDSVSDKERLPDQVEKPKEIQMMDWSDGLPEVDENEVEDEIKAPGAVSDNENENLHLDEAPGAPNPQTEVPDVDIVTNQGGVAVEQFGLPMILA